MPALSDLDKARNELIKAWKECPLDKGSVSFLLPEDRPVIEAWSESKQGREPVLYTSEGFESFIASHEFMKQSKRLHLSLLPHPYAGDLKNATIFLLMLNPGVGPCDYYAEQESSDYRKALVRTIRQELNGLNFPMMWLDPNFSWTGGGVWWQNKFRATAQAVVEAGITQGGIQKAYHLLSRNIAVLELYPYHSQSFGLPKIAKNLHSVQLMRAFLDRLIQEAKQDKVLLIATRQARTWGVEAHKNILIYDANQARSAHLYVDHENERAGGTAILKWLQRAGQGIK